MELHCSTISCPAHCEEIFVRVTLNTSLCYCFGNNFLYFILVFGRVSTEIKPSDNIAKETVNAALLADITVSG